MVKKTSRTWNFLWIFDVVGFEVSIWVYEVVKQQLK